MKKIRKIAGFLAGVVALTSFSAGVLAADEAETVFNYTFDTAGASMEVLDSTKTAAQMEAITNTWIDQSIYNTGKYRAVNANSQIIDAGMSYGLEANVYGRSGNALKITGNDKGTFDGSDGNRLRIFNIKQINKSYTDYESLDCTEDGAFVISFDFATSDLRVPFALRCNRTVFYGENGLAESAALGKTLFVLNKDGSIKVFNNTVPSSSVGSVSENAWHHAELVFAGSNKFGIKLDGKVIQQMTALTGADAAGSLRSLGDAINIPVNYGNSTVSGGENSTRYIDNFKYEIHKTDKFDTIEDDELVISVTEGDTVLMKSCQILFVERTKKVADLKAAVSASTCGGSTMTAVVSSSDGVLSDDDTLENAVSLELRDAYSNTKKTFRIADPYETIAEQSQGAPTSWQVKGGCWSKADFGVDSCIYTAYNIGGKTADDAFMAVKNPAANASSYPSFNYWIVDEKLTVNAPFTLEYSLYLPKMAATDTASNLYMYLNGTNKAGGSAADNVLKIAPSPKNGNAVIYNNNNNADAIAVQLGKWNKIAVEASPAKNEFTVYVNGKKLNKITNTNVSGVTRIRFSFEGKSDACLFGIDDFKVHRGAYNYPVRDAAITLADASGKFTVENQPITNGKIKAKVTPVTINDIAELVGESYDYRIYTDDSFSSEATELKSGSVLVVNNGNGLYAYYDIDPETSEMLVQLKDGAPSVGTSDKKGLWSRGSISGSELSNCIFTANGLGGKTADDSFMVLKNTSANNSSEANLNYWIENGGEYTDSELEIEYSIYIPVLQKNDNVSSLYMQIIGSDSNGGSGRYYAYKIIPSRTGKNATILNNNSNADRADVTLGRWNKIAAKLDPKNRKYTLYVNGIAFKEITDTPLDKITRICFKVEGASDVCGFAIDDLKIRKGAFDYTEKSPEFYDASGKFLFKNDALLGGTFTATDDAVTKADLSAVSAGCSFKLFEDDLFAKEASELSEGTVLVADNGNGMYAYYTVPEVFVDAEYADKGSISIKQLKLRILYNGTADADNVTVSVAQYLNGELLKVSSAGTASFGKDNSFMFDVRKDANIQTAFIWKTGTLQPISQPAAVPVE